MKNSIGTIIRRLRKERGMTQEELALQLNVTAQSISKWENGTGMPDLTKIVPLANIFGISTEVLFGRADINDDEEIEKIIKKAKNAVSDSSDIRQIKEWRRILLEGLEKYPANTRLLSECLESGIALAYPNNDIFDKEKGKDIYNESIRQARIIIEHSKNINEILRAHMIMVLLHSAYGNFEEAEAHGNNFPWRCDMTASKMYSYISEFKNDTKSKTIYCQWNIFYCFEAILDTMLSLAGCYYKSNELDKAEATLIHSLDFIDSVCKDENAKPPFHYREEGDIYNWLAKIYISKGDEQKGVEYLSKLLDYEIKEREKYKNIPKMTTPLFCNIDLPVHHDRHNSKKKLEIIFSHYDSILKDNIDFQKLVAEINE